MYSVSLPEPQQQSYNFNNNNESEIELPIQSIHASDDGKFMVTMSHTRENAIHIFYRKDHKAHYEHYWTLPSLGGSSNGNDDSSRPAAIAIVDGNKLAVATYRSHIYLFNIESKSLNEWSEQHGFPIKDNKWTDDLLCDKGYPLRLIPIKDQKDRLIMTSFGTFCVIDISKPMPRQCRNIPRKPAWKKRRKHKPIVHQDDDDDEEDDDHNDKKVWLERRITKVVEDEYSHGDADAPPPVSPFKKRSTSSSLTVANGNTHSPTPNEVSDEEIATKNCTICSHYKNMLYTDFLGPKEMVVVEQPWLDVAETFQAALQRRIYGAD